MNYGESDGYFSHPEMPEQGNFVMTSSIRPTNVSCKQKREQGQNAQIHD